MESQNDPQMEKRRPAVGVVFWVVFSFVTVILRGVTWDETYEHALAITGIAPYPEGHPFYLYIRNIFSLQSYLSAGILWLTKAPLLICYLRDVATLLLMTLPLFFLGYTLTKRALWSHVTVVLGLSNAYIIFASHYGIGVWPGYFSVGAIGAGYALLVFTAFVANWNRTAWFLLTLLTSIHLGHWPPLMMYAGFQLIHWDAAKHKEHWRAAIIWGGAGLAISVLFFLVLRFFHVPYPVDGPYVAEGDAHAIWINYSTREDVHRFIQYLRPFSYSVLLIVIVVLVSGCALICAPPGKRSRSPFARILLYAGCVALLSMGIRTVHAIVGDNIPFLLIGWMPYRIPNQLAPVLLGGLLAIVAAGVPDKPRYRPEMWAAVLMLLALPVASGGFLIPEGIFSRYFAGGEFLIFVLLGGAMATLTDPIFARPNPRRRPATVALVIGLFALLWFNQFMAACAIAGAAFHVVLRVSVRTKLAPTAASRIAWACVALTLTTHVVREYQQRDHLPRTTFQQGVVDYLASVDESRAMIIPPIWEVEWSARLGVPVFADYGTPRYVTYVPALAPSIMKMHRDVFGFNIDGTPNENQRSWQTYTPAEWTALGEQYGFRYVVQPTDIPLTIEAVYSEDDYVLYAIPSPSRN